MLPGKYLLEPMSITFCNLNSEFFYDSEYENPECFVCGNRFIHKKDMVSQMDKYMETRYIVQKQQFSCHFCSNEWSQDKVICYTEMCTEDEDSLDTWVFNFHMFCRTFVWSFVYGWNQPGREKAKKLGILPFTYWVLLTTYIFFCFAGNCHVFEAYRGESYYGI